MSAVEEIPAETSSSLNREISLSDSVVGVATSTNAVESLRHIFCTVIARCRNDVSMPVNARRKLTTSLSTFDPITADCSQQGLSGS